jgi:hypothetical protein
MSKLKKIYVLVLILKNCKWLLVKSKEVMITGLRLTESGYSTNYTVQNNSFNIPTESKKKNKTNHLQYYRWIEFFFLQTRY